MSNVRAIIVFGLTALLEPLAMYVWPRQVRAQTSKVPVSLRKSAECMFKALQTVPGVSEPKLGYVTSDGWTHPYLEYRAAEHSPSVQHPRFEAIKSDDGTYWFLAVLSGWGAPSTAVSGAVIEKWKTQCAVAANIMFP